VYNIYIHNIPKDKCVTGENKKHTTRHNHSGFELCYKYVTGYNVVSGK